MSSLSEGLVTVCCFALLNGFSIIAAVSLNRGLLYIFFIMGFRKTFEANLVEI